VRARPDLKVSVQTDGLPGENDVIYFAPETAPTGDRAGYWLPFVDDTAAIDLPH